MALDIEGHAPEIAGFAALVAAVVPWSVSFSGSGFSGFVALRFVFGSLHVVSGARAADVAGTVLPVTRVGELYGGDLARMATLWLVAAALLVVALLVGVSLFVVGERLSTGPLDPVRIVGALCLCMALSLSGATWLLWQHTPRIPIPLGVVLLYFVGGGLLTIDRNRGGNTAAGTSG